MDCKIEESSLAHTTMRAQSDVSNFANTSLIILRQDEICLFKDMCPFNTRPDRCHGAVERKNDFVCNLKQMKSMHKSAVE